MDASELTAGLASTDPTSVAVIVINYRTATLAIHAVESVLEQDHGDLAVTVHVVDNASPGDDADILTSAHGARGWGDRVVLHLEKENHGFGRGNNVVIENLSAQEAPPDKIFLLNPDAKLSNGAIRILAEALDADPEAGAAGAAVVDEDNIIVAGPGVFPTMVGEILRFLNFGPVDRVLGHRRDMARTSDQKCRADWVSGAAVMFRLNALRKAGFFDPTFFLYYEEVELMLRLSLAGYPTLYVPEARVFHDRGGSTGRVGARAAREPGYFYDSWRHYFVVSHGRLKTLLLSLVLLPVAAFNIVMRRMRGQVPNIPSHFFADHWSHVIRPLLFGDAKAGHRDGTP